MYSPKDKLKILEDKLVEQVVYDVLHMKWQRFNSLNDGEHTAYKEIIEELKARYKKQQTTNNQ